MGILLPAKSAATETRILLAEWVIKSEVYLSNRQLLLPGAWQDWKSEKRELNVIRKT